MGSRQVRVFEVGPRDGLQNERRKLSSRDKISFISGLVRAGVRDMEIGAFVRKDKVPQMADTDEIYKAMTAGRLKLGQANGWSLVPNMKGLERALKAGATNLALFTAATDSFARKNIGMSVKESFFEFKRVISHARSEVGAAVRFRGYVSTAFGCPFEGKVTPKRVLAVIEKLADLGVGQVSIGDTIGVATPREVELLVEPALRILGLHMTAVHFHDTRGTALANALRALEFGVRIFDSSAGGLGGCPFAPGAAGNLATEDLVYMIHGMGLKTGIDLEKLCRVSLRLSRTMRRPLSSRYLQAFASRSR